MRFGGILISSILMRSFLENGLFLVGEFFWRCWVRGYGKLRNLWFASLCHVCFVMFGECSLVKGEMFVLKFFFNYFGKLYQYGPQIYLDKFVNKLTNFETSWQIYQLFKNWCLKFNIQIIWKNGIFSTSWQKYTSDF